MATNEPNVVDGMTWVFFVHGQVNTGRRNIAAWDETGRYARIPIVDARNLVRDGMAIFAEPASPPDDDGIAEPDLVAEFEGSLK